MSNIIKPKTVDFENVPTTHVTKTGKKTPDFYKGTSFRWCREWEPGRSYVNDDYHVDLVYHKGKSWICTESHISNAENAPSEDVSVWELAVNQSRSGVHVGPNPPTEKEYGDLATKMLWLDTDEEDNSLRVYSTDQTYNKSEVDSRIKEVTDNVTSLSGTVASNHNAAIQAAAQALADAKADAAELYQVKGDYESAGAAASAETAAKKYADSLASNYDKKGAAGEALATAKLDATTKADTALASAKTYTNAEIAKLSKVYDVKGTAAGLNAAMDKRVDKLESIDHTQLAKDASAAAVATILDGAPEKFDTLKEVAQWISDSEAAAEAANLITKVSNLESGKVDKIEGKKLSTNDFTNEYKQKVDEFIVDKKLSTTSNNAIANRAVMQALVDKASKEDLTDAIQGLEGEVYGDLDTLNYKLYDKPNKDGYYPSMSVGMADNLVGRGDVQDAQINFRPSAGADNITDGAARIERIKGNSVVWNQLVNTDSISVELVAKHTYFTDINGEQSVRIISATTTIEAQSGRDKVVDLTQMFGTGNEPTSYEEYYQRKPMNIEDEYAYNAGTLVDMKVDSLISTSDNAYDYVKGYARVMGGQTYDCSYGTAFVEKVYFSTDKDNIVAEENAMTSENGKYTFPSDGYAVPYTTDGDKREYCVCLQHSYTKPHPAYQQEVKDLSFIGEAFPEGMRSVGSVYDEIRFNPTKKVWEKVTRIGVATNLTFISGGGNLFATSISDIKLPVIQADRNKGVFSNKYVSSKRTSTSTQDDKSILRFAQKNNIYIKDTSYTSVTEFNEGNQDLVIYYELAEPIVEEIDLSPNFNLDYFAWDFGTEEAIASVLSAPFRADIQYGDNFVDDIRKNKEDIATNKANIAKNASAINSKQDTLTLTTKPNGNIVIGNLAGQSKEFMPATPSGDPMHYMYLKVPLLSYDETTGLWAYRADEGGLTDLTTEEVQTMWLVAGGLDMKNSNYCRWAKRIDALFPARTNICPIYYGEGQGYSNQDWNYAFNQNPTIEVAVITYEPTTYSSIAAQPYYCAGMFTRCAKLRKIIGGLSFEYIYKQDSRYTNMFTQCPLLESVEIWLLNRNLRFPDSPLLSKESLLFMINNCASNVTFTITLHPDVYSKCQEGGEWYSEVNTALSAALSDKTTTITLASA